MNIKKSFALFVSAFLVLQVGCTSHFVDKFEGGNFIAVISDVHISNDQSKEERLSRLIDRINNGSNPKIDRLIITGDCVSSVYADYEKGESNSNNRLKKFVDCLKPLDVPYYPVMGNHDFKIDKERDSDAPFDKFEIERMEQIWMKTTGFQPYYSIYYKGWKLVFLNSMNGKGENKSFGERQLNWLRDELQDDAPAILFFHHPINTDNTKIWCKPKDLITQEKEPEFFNILSYNKDKIKGIFVGHGHMWVSDKLFNQINVYETDSFGDNEEITYAVIGLDKINERIFVVKCAGIK